MSDKSNKTENDIRIIAIGASAGGLEPIETFFETMPSNSGCSFVVIQHLSPDFRSLMDELLGRRSNMSIHRVVDGMTLESNSIYLNPARAVMTLEGDTFRVKEIDTETNVYLPIDLFLDSLARSKGPKPVAIVLSGTGTDGTRGATKIKNAGGSVLVQEPDTTRFDGMPNSVIALGIADLIAPPKDLQRAVLRILKNQNIDDLSSDVREPLTEPFQDLLSILKHQHGTNFEQYKETTIKRRIERRAQMHNIDSIDDYRDRLLTDTSEVEELYADLLIEVTEFFRDQAAFEVIETKVVPALMEDKTEHSSIRIWVPGCASGEEAYSLAILLLEHGRRAGINPKIKILATDVHSRSMNKAGQGRYDEASLRKLPSEIIERYFHVEDGQAQIKKSVKNLVFFSTHDLTRDPPFTRIDLISCRNLLIYLKDSSQNRVMNLLHFSLHKGGFLFLGPSEHIGPIAHEFETLSEKWRIFKKTGDTKLLPVDSIFQQTDTLQSLVSTSREKGFSTPSKVNRGANSAEAASLQRAQQFALESIVSNYAPPGFLLKDDGTLIHIFGDAGALIPLRSGAFSKRITDLIREDLRTIVSAALDQSKNSKFSGFDRTVYLNDSDISTSYDISLQILDIHKEPQKYLLLSIKENFQDEKNKIKTMALPKDTENTGSDDSLRQKVLILEHNLQASEQSLQSTIEELEASNEELQSTNEELMSTNEEMQSTNEELHSVNEELYTVSAEHQRKNEELTERDIDLEILLQQSKIGTVHLDNELNLLRYTTNAGALFNIMPQDAGRPFHHITMRTTDISVMPIIRNIKAADQPDDMHFSTESNTFLVRTIKQYSDSNEPLGVMLTIINITDMRNIKVQLDELKQLDEQYADLITHTGNFVVSWDAGTELITRCSHNFAERWDSTDTDLIGRNIIELRGRKDREKFRESLTLIEPNKSSSIMVSSENKSGRALAARITIRAVSANNKHIDEYQAIGIDCTEQMLFQSTTNQLLDVVHDNSLSKDEKLSELLQIGLQYFELDTGVIGLVDGEKYTVVAVESKTDVSYQPGTVLELENTLCSQFTDEKRFFALSNVSATEPDERPCYIESNIECLIGASLGGGDNPRGAVSFSSSLPHPAAFTSSAEAGISLLAAWVSFVLAESQA